jgi:hypothetical protein
MVDVTDIPGLNKSIRLSAVVKAFREGLRRHKSEDGELETTALPLIGASLRGHACH